MNGLLNSLKNDLLRIGVLLGIIREKQNMPEPIPPQIPTAPKQNRIHLWALAIGVQEGAKKSINNPGNLKLAPLTKTWGARPGFQATDGGWIAAFDTLEKGETALENFLILGAHDELKAFHNARTLLAFSNVYAGNPPVEYPAAIARALGVPLDIDVKELL